MARVLAFINPASSTRNVGDLFIENSVKRILRFDRDASFDIDPRQAITARHICRINTADAAVIVGTNLWYRSMPQPSRWNFRLEDLRQIRVPIIPMGVGTTRHFGDDNGFERDTLAQLQAIHSSCAAGSARDPRTAEVLREAGLRNVVMTGCPTLFRSLAPRWELRRKASRQIVVTVRKGQKSNVCRLLKLIQQRGLEPVVAAQQANDLFLSYSLPFFRKATPTVFQFDLAPYEKLLEESCGAIGWRLHGNMLHLAHGNPAIMFANCSRCASFCDLFGLPTVCVRDHENVTEVELTRMLDHFLDDATFQPLTRRYPEVRGAMIQFLEANGLEHNLREGIGQKPEVPSLLGNVA